MSKDMLHLSDEVEGEEVEEGEETETEEEETEESEEGAPKPGTVAHKRARGDELADEEEDPDATADELEEVATGGKRTGSLRERLSQVTDERNRAVEAALKLAEKIGAVAPAAAAKKDDPPPYDFKAKRREANKLLLEGDEEAAAAIQDEIDEQRQALADAKAESKADQRVAAALEGDRAAAAIAEGFEKYPFLDDTNKDVKHNKEALSDVEMYRNRYLNEGHSLSTALRKAIVKVGPMYAETEGEEEPDEGDDEPAAKKESSVDTSIRERLRKRTLANAKAEKRQPPQTSKFGTAHRDRIDPSTIDIENMTDKEWDELPEATKKKLRGDSLSA